MGLIETIAALWLDEVSAETAQRLDSFPELGLALRDRRAEALADLADQRARLLADNIPVTASAYIDMPGGAEPDTGGSEPDTGGAEPRAGASLPPDHLGNLLLALDAADRTGSERDALRQVERLAAWLPAMAWQLRRQQPPPLYGALAELTLDMVLSRLGREPSITWSPAASPTTRPPATDDGASAPDDLAPLERLLAPAVAGAFLPRGELLRLAQWLGLPPPPPGRGAALRALAQSARQSGQLDRLLDGLDNLLVDARLDNDGLADAYPAWQPYRRVWDRRISGGREVIEDVRQAARRSPG